MSSGLGRPATFAKKEPLVARSLLFVPANVDKYIDKAHTRGADIILLDVEDSIALSEKDNARRRVAAASQRLSRNGVRRIFVRINNPVRMAVRDLEAIISPLINGIILPKSQTAEQVRMISEVISELEAERGMEVGATELGARIETAPAFFKMDEIAAADPRVTSFGLGGEDFSFAIGVEPSPETMLYPKQRAVIAARAAGVTPIGLVGSGADFTNLDVFREVVRKSRRFGFEGSSCIHPAIVPILNEEFTPPVEEVERAERLLDTFSESIAAGVGAVSFEGKMIDYPVAFRAERIVNRYRALTGQSAG
jgi:citrate lyase subunit beta/citryl-CoA lyase